MTRSDDHDRSGRRPGQTDDKLQVSGTWSHHCRPQRAQRVTPHGDLEDEHAVRDPIDRHVLSTNSAQRSHHMAILRTSTECELRSIAMSWARPWQCHISRSGGTLLGVPYGGSRGGVPEGVPPGGPPGARAGPGGEIPGAGPGAPGGRRGAFSDPQKPPFLGPDPLLSLLLGPQNGGSPLGGPKMGPRGTKKCTKKGVFNNSPIRDTFLDTFFAPLFWTLFRTPQNGALLWGFSGVSGWAIP